MSEIEVAPTGSALGADVTHLDLSQPLGRNTVDRLRKAFLSHGLLRFRNQRLDKAAQVRFSAYFGQPVPHPTNLRNRDPDFPEITIISNIREGQKAVGALGNAELQFHVDLVFLHEPGTISLLYCLETPQRGGDTYWASGYAAYNHLTNATKERISRLKVIYIHRKAEYNPPLPPAHPLVCTHPETGRKSLFLSPSAARTVEGLEEQEGRSLLTQLYAHATADKFVWRHRWKPGDLIMWDNRCTMHRRDGFDNRQRRLMLRTQMVGPCTA